MKNSNDTFGNRTRDLPTCSAVSQPTAPPRTPEATSFSKILKSRLRMGTASVLILAGCLIQRYRAAVSSSATEYTDLQRYFVSRPSSNIQHIATTVLSLLKT